MARVRLEGIEKRFGRTRVLKGVDLEVQDREFLVLLGPSGCGKTTLLRIVAGLERPDRGRVFLGEREVTSLPPRARGLAMVFQNYAVFPHLTVRENIAFGLRMRRYPEGIVREKVERAAELLRIGELLDRYPAQLSGGQRQRVAVARALAVEPEVLLMDEPLSNLDALLRLELRAELKRLLKTTGVTTLYVTHDQMEAMGMADRIAVMREGEIVQCGPPLEVYQKPVDTFVGGFLGHPPMNFLRLGPEEASFLLGDRREVLVGIRPEDLQVFQEEVPGGVPGRILVVEPLGPHQLVTLEAWGQALKATVPSSLSLEPGNPVWLKISKESLRLFDPRTGRVLLEVGRAP
uniref:ABC transporter ATP-binding protein n=1 Tax=Thermus caliditerrae TaxID=1330700 RepID=A0A7C5VHH1_9DEIN